MNKVDNVMQRIVLSTCRYVGVGVEYFEHVNNVNNNQEQHSQNKAILLVQHHNITQNS